jgi:hypothetical protein
MNLQLVIEQLQLKILTGSKDFSDVIPTGGYASDLLSCVMAGTAPGNIWITLQAHTNIVAVAALKELSAVIISEGASPDEITLSKAREEEIILLSTPMSTYWVVGKLWELGLKS